MPKQLLLTFISAGGDRFEEVLSSTHTIESTSFAFVFSVALDWNMSTWAKFGVQEALSRILDDSQNYESQGSGEECLDETGHQWITDQSLINQ